MTPVSTTQEAPLESTTIVSTTQEAAKPPKPPKPSGDSAGLLSGLLANKHLGLKGGGSAGRFGFALGGRAPADVSSELERAGARWPGTFKKQVGLGLTALGRLNSSPDSMSAGAALLGGGSSAEILKSLLGALKGELKILKLPAEARGELGRLLSDSGLEQERIGEILSQFGPDGLSLAALDKYLAKLDLSGTEKRGLIADETSLADLSLFLASLGASAEFIEKSLSELKPGQNLSGEDLAEIFRQAEPGGLAGDLSAADLRSLAAFLRQMGAEAGEMEKLAGLLNQTQGRLPTEEFLQFLDGLKGDAAQSAAAPDLETLKNIWESVARESELARTPVFNEILIKLEALGDDKINNDFMNLSPALQALRGGLSGSGDFSRQFNGQGGGRDSQERYRKLFHAQAAGLDAASPAAAAVAESQTAGYGGRSESLARQIAQKIVYGRRRGLHRLKMNLNPAELGRLDIELSVKDGVLAARIRAADRAAYEALGEELENLKNSLAESGLDVTDLTLTYEDEAGGQTLGLAELNARAEAQAEAQAEKKRRPETGAAWAGEINRVI